MHSVEILGSKSKQQNSSYILTYIKAIEREKKNEYIDELRKKSNDDITVNFDVIFDPLAFNRSESF